MAKGKPKQQQVPDCETWVTGQNVTSRIEKGVLEIRVDLNKRYGLSESEKTIRIASTCGNQVLPTSPKIKFGLNVYEKAPKKA